MFDTCEKKDVRMFALIKDEQMFAFLIMWENPMIEIRMCDTPIFQYPNILS